VTVPDGLPVLSRGKHTRAEDGACAAELHTVLVGEPFTDRCDCADSVLLAVLRAVNDALDDDERHLLIPHLERVSGTRQPPPGRPVWTPTRAALLALDWPPGQHRLLRADITDVVGPGDLARVAIGLVDTAVLSGARGPALVRLLTGALDAHEVARGARRDPDRAPALPSGA